MTGASSLASVLLGALLLTAPATGAAEGILFAESYEKAFQEANERGVPITILVIQDDEEANEDVWHNTLCSKEFVAATHRTVNLIGNRGRHETREVDVDGQPVKVCAKFGSVRCEDHVRTEIGIFRDFARDGAVRTPQVLVVLPDQTIVQQLHDRHPLGAFVGAIEAAEAKLPNGLSQEEAAAVRQGLANARGWLAEGNVVDVIAFASPFRDRKTGAGLVARVNQLLSEVETRGKGELAAIEEQITNKQYPAAMGALDALVARYRGSPVAEVAKERRADLAKNREVKTALVQHKREVDARKLLENADGLAERGQGERAQKLYDRLLERFADTQAAVEYKQRG